MSVGSLDIAEDHEIAAVTAPPESFQESSLQESSLQNPKEGSAAAQEESLATDTGDDLQADPSEDEIEEEARELGLPSPRTLGPGSDFKPFMASDVPDYLRRFALRRLWRSNPVLANVDGLVDYGEDFTDAATVFEGMKTAYQVGTGYFRAVVEEEEEENLPESLEPAEEMVADAEDAEEAEGAEDAGDVESAENTDAAPHPGKNPDVVA